MRLGVSWSRKQAVYWQRGEKHWPWPALCLDLFHGTQLLEGSILGVMEEA
jgi:hypothetical protein